MKYIVMLATTTLIHILVPFVLILLSSKTSISTKDTITLKYSKFFVFVGIGGSIFALSAYILSMQDLSENLKAFVFCTVGVLIMVLSCFWLFLQGLNWKIILCEDVLIHRNFLRVTKTYSYTEITKVKTCYNRKTKQVEKYKIFVGKQKITVESFVENFTLFNKLIGKKLKKVNNPVFRDL